MARARPVNWSDDPGEKRRMLQIVRAPYTGKAHWDILSDRAFGVFLHWVAKARRNQPCAGEHCNLCEVDCLPSKWVGYLAVAEPATGRIRLAEVTSEAWIEGKGAALQQQLQTLRGMVLELSRDSPGRTGKVRIRILRPDPPRMVDVPGCPNVKDELCAIWQSKLFF